MTEPFVAEIAMLPYTFAPRGWAACDGQLLLISQNTALFALIGTYYGGNGKDNFALPDLQGRAPMHWGQGPGLTERNLGESGGGETVTLTQGEMPAHTHQLLANNRLGRSGVPQDNALATSDGATMYSNAVPGTSLSPAAVQVAGGSMPHDNMQPYLPVQFCIALQGVFPPRP